MQIVNVVRTMDVVKNLDVKEAVIAIMEAGVIKVPVVVRGKTAVAVRI